MLVVVAHLGSFSRHTFSQYQIDMAGFSEMLKVKVAAAMQGADKKALESRAYKGVVKHVVVRTVGYIRRL